MRNALRVSLCVQAALLLVSCDRADRLVGPAGVHGPIQFTLVQGGTWTTKAPMPTARTDLQVAGVNGILFAIGGTPADGVTTGKVEAYDPATDTWVTKASMPTARNDLGVGVINGIIYAVGGCPGFCGSTFTTLEAYDPGTDIWTTKTPMPTARTARVGVVGGKLYVIGGFTGSSLLGTVEVYDPATDTWSTKAPMPTPRAGHGVGVVNGIIYAVGGVASGGIFVATVEAYDPASDTWTTKAPLPTARVDLAVGVVGGKLYALGGWDAGGVVLATVDAYDPTTDTWSTVASMPTARRSLGVGVVDRTLYAVGGSTHEQVQGVGHARLATNEAFNPVRTVGIDIKPGSDPNTINPRSRGTIPVAILSTADFDAPTEVDRSSLTFGRTGDEPSLAFCTRSAEDVNLDGLLDLVCHFENQKTGFQVGDTEGILKGQTTHGVPIEGRDAVRVVG